MLLIGCNETVVEPYNLGGDNLGTKSIVIKKYERRNEDKVMVGHYLEEYNKKGLLTTRIEYNLMEEGKIYSKHERFYDRDDNIFKSLTHTNGELEWEMIYTYKKKKIHEIENYHDGDLVSTTIYEYKNNYRKSTWRDLVNDTEQVSEEFYNDDGSYTLENVMDNQYKTVLKVNSDNQVLETSRFEDDILTESSVAEYDENGNKTKLISIDSDGVQTIRTFEYDEFNHLVRFGTNHESSDFDMEYIYEYDDKGNYISKVYKMYDEVSHYEERTITYWE